VAPQRLTGAKYGPILKTVIVMRGELIYCVGIRAGKAGKRTSGDVECSPAQEWKMAKSNIYRDTIQPTLAEIAESRPPRGSGAPFRTRSHYQRIRTLLFERGDIGVDASELYAHPDLYGRSPRNRISELRTDLKKEGSVYMISGKAKGSSDWHYKLIRVNAGWQPRPFSEKRMAQDDCFVLTPPEPRR
jgi:hypothetical protein